MKGFILPPEKKTGSQSGSELVSDILKIANIPQKSTNKMDSSSDLGELKG
jgi:hypothetical protein